MIKVICVTNLAYSDYTYFPSLTIGKKYDVIEKVKYKGSSAYRIMNDRGNVNNYPLQNFKDIVEARIDRINDILK